MRFLLAVPATLLALAPAAAGQEPQSEETSIYAQIDGGSSTKGERRTVFGRVFYGAVPGMYEIHESMDDEGEWTGRFTIYVDRLTVSGKTTLALDRAGYTRAWSVTGGTRACSTAEGLLSSTGSFRKDGSFYEILRGEWECTGVFVGHGPPQAKSRRFKSAWNVVPTSRGALIGRERGSLMYTKRGLIYAYEEGKRCFFENWDGAGNLYGSAPCRTPGRRFKPRDGSAQLTGRGDPEYRHLSATGPFKLKGKLDGDRQGKLKLRGKAFW